VLQQMVAGRHRGNVRSRITPVTTMEARERLPYMLPTSRIDLCGVEAVHLLQAQCEFILIPYV
jgi:hypothetical protein